MKTTALFLFFFVFCLSAESIHSQNTKFSLQKTHAPLGEIIEEIEQQSNYLFVYTRDVDINREYSVNEKQSTIRETLDNLFASSGIKYDIEGSYIVLSTGQTEVSSPASQQNGFSVSGVVVDSRGEPVIGANVSVKGTTTGNITNIDGEFTLSVPQGATLVVSYIGYITREIVVNSQTSLRIVLSEDTQTLDEVVVVGYGTVKKRDLTGSVSSISAAKIAEVPALTATEVLQGRIPGALVTNTSWGPGATASILIRGKRSIKASNDPLYVVDGIPMTAGMSEISPSDIESIDVLKDASATAIYGARGANGVILITTKKGAEGTVQVDYNGYVGAQTILNQVELMNGAEYAEYVRESYRTIGRYDSDVPNKDLDFTLPSFGGGDPISDPYTWESIAMGYDANGNYDPSKVRSSAEWWKDVARTGMITNHELSIRGGTDKTQYMTGVTYHDNKGIYKDRDYERYSVRFNLNHQIGERIKIGGNTQFSRSVNNRGNGLQNNWRVNPLGRYYDDEGNLLKMVSGTDTQWWNPLQYLVPGNKVNPLTQSRYLGSYYGEIELPVDGLRFRTNLGIDFLATQDYNFASSDARQGANNSANNNTKHEFMYTWENLLYYDKTIKEHRFGVTLLQSIQEYTMDQNNIPVEKLPSDDLLWYDVGSAQIPGSISSNHQRWSLASFMARLNYGFRDRYLLTVSARYDGSSRLADGHKWILFPAAALAWRMNEEAFLRDVSAVDNLKLRFGVGTTANTAIGPYQTKGQLSTRYYNYGSNNIIGYAPGGLPNRALTWESTSQWNLGIDFSFLRRISGTVDLYLSNTFDLLLDRQLPVVSGYGSVLSNVGKTQNQGLEISLNTINTQQKNFTWTTDWMFYTNKEKIVELYNGKQDDIGSGWFIGKPINVFFNYKKTGIWQNTEADRIEMEKFNANGGTFKPGSIRLLDKDGDYKITAEDRVIQGQARPKFIASIINNFQYRDFDLSIFLYGSFGSMIENGFSYFEQAYRNNNVKTNYWTPNNPSNDAPRPDQSTPPAYVNTMRYEKADFLRIRTITLGYTLPKNITQRLTMRNCRVYATAQNPWIWTNFSGVDPEGASGYAAPSVSSWILGLNIGF
ncbi:MAG: TonB-dependent receptor [Tannerellaceae bacterium]|nr:TonB-dependent receptor [Tannerellaceae bacterium]